MRKDGKIIENTLDKFSSFSYRLNVVEICAPIYIRLSKSGCPGFEDFQDVVG